jgi:hypothetical protein
MSRLASFVFVAGMLCSVSAMASGPYDGHKIVRVWPESTRQQLAITQIPMSLMEEGERRDGGTAYLADPEALALLRSVGVAFEIVVDDVQAMVDAEKSRLDARTRWGLDVMPRGDDSFFQEFRDFDELNAFFDALMLTHPGLIARESIGSSIQSRAIEAFTIAAPGDPDSRPSIIFNGTAHAREWISPMTVAYIMRELLDNYASDERVTRILDSVTFRIAPIMNPDGFVYSWNSQRLWRKNRRNNGDGTFGVDWNRNWATGWGGTGSSGTTSSDVYRGTAPFSEPETVALRDYILATPNTAFHIDFHSYSQLVLWPWGYTNGEIPEPDRTIHQNIAVAYADTIASETGAAYDPIKSSDLYLAGGASSDWAYSPGGVFSLTVELRPLSEGQGGFAPSPTIILPTARENFAAVLELAETVATGVSLAFVDGAPMIVEPNAPTPITISITPVFSGPLDPFSGLLWSRIGNSGPFSPSTLTPVAGVYTGELPAAPCGSVVQYFFEIDSNSGVTYTIPFAAPASTYTAQAIERVTAFEDDMETDTGWIVGAPGDNASTGIWERTNPQGTTAQPEDDHTPTGTDCWVTDGRAGTGTGSYDVDDGVTTLTSPRLDATGAGEAFLSFWVWYSNDLGAAPGEDSMPVLISDDDGATWVLLEDIGVSTSDWENRRFRVADFVTPSDAIRVRFQARDLGSGSLVEAAVDDLSIGLIGCTGNPADLAPPFGVLDLADIAAFIDGFVNGDPIADLAPPFGVFDLADVGAFVAAFVAGIP